MSALQKQKQCYFNLHDTLVYIMHLKQLSALVYKIRKKTALEMCWHYLTTIQPLQQVTLWF